ncbi:hypothetical protein JXA80_04585 [bacterium]|nr:hypothetical protein [candidate division CSSED10-310 bacterium]
MTHYTGTIPITPPMTSWESPFPKYFPDPNREEELRLFLLSHSRPITRTGRCRPPFLPVDTALAHALFVGYKARTILRGIPSIEKCLLTESQGIMKINRVANAQLPRRISRILIFSEDIAPRLAIRIERFILEYHPRIAALGIPCSADQLCTILTGNPGDAKVLLAVDKHAISLILTSLLNRIQHATDTTN